MRLPLPPAWPGAGTGVAAALVAEPALRHRTSRRVPSSSRAMVRLLARLFGGPQYSSPDRAATVAGLGRRVEPGRETGGEAGDEHRMAGLHFCFGEGV